MLKSTGEFSGRVVLYPSLPKSTVLLLLMFMLPPPFWNFLRGRGEAAVSSRRERRRRRQRRAAAAAAAAATRDSLLGHRARDALREEVRVDAAVCVVDHCAVPNAERRGGVINSGRGSCVSSKGAWRGADCAEAEPSRRSGHARGRLVESVVQSVAPLAAWLLVLGAEHTCDGEGPQ